MLLFPELSAETRGGSDSEKQHTALRRSQGSAWRKDPPRAPPNGFAISLPRLKPNEWATRFQTLLGKHLRTFSSAFHLFSRVRPQSQSPQFFGLLWKVSESLARNRFAFTSDGFSKTNWFWERSRSLLPHACPPPALERPPASGAFGAAAKGKTNHVKLRSNARKAQRFSSRSPPLGTGRREPCRRAAPVLGTQRGRRPRLCTPAPAAAPPYLPAAPPARRPRRPARGPAAASPPWRRRPGPTPPRAPPRAAPPPGGELSRVAELLSPSGGCSGACRAAARRSGAGRGRNWVAPAKGSSRCFSDRF